MSDAATTPRQSWLGPGVAGIGTASFLADVGHEIPTAALWEWTHRRRHGLIGPVVN